MKFVLHTPEQTKEIDMPMGGILLTHAIAHRERKPPFFFSRFNFERMREIGNTHYCFYCGGGQGFIPGPNGEATNSIEPSGYDATKHHDPAAHADAIVGNAEKYEWAGDWLGKEIGEKPFPFIVHIPSV
ncbi:MAG: hypothetical protein Q7S05_03355 [bacterium]|nr:hypothetical protein [bacterium]